MENDLLEVYVESEERHRILSDEKVKFLYSRSINMIHDKHCECARDISDEDLAWSDEYFSDMQQCPICAIQSYVAVGAKDPEEMRTYLNFYKRTKSTADQVRDIYIEKGMKTRISLDTLTIWYKDDAWRIKALPYKGHVQLLHNNYAVGKGGIREKLLGFHIQGKTGEDTDMACALGIIKSYKYVPSEYLLHKRNADPKQVKKMMLKEAEKSEREAESLEEMLGYRSEPKSLWQRIKWYFHNGFKKKNFFELNDFNMVEEKGFPANQTVCIYIWKDKNDQLSWQTGSYNKKLKQFSVQYGINIYAINQTRVVAWKKMNADAVALEIND